MAATPVQAFARIVVRMSLNQFNHFSTCDEYGNSVKSIENNEDRTKTIQQSTENSDENLPTIEQ
jgi:hypothetical protein